MCVMCARVPFLDTAAHEPVLTSKREDLLVRGSKNQGNSVLLYSLRSDCKHSIALNYLNTASSLLWAKYWSIDLTSWGSVTVNAVVRSAPLR